ncbi:MAG: glycogen debranching protein, partial [Planctomycetota bacterium]
TVELLPVFQFDELAPDHHDPETGERLRDYWGYNPIGFFAPHRGYYLEDWSGMSHLTGFRDLVRALHQAGLEVILDVVFNHTSEGSAAGPTLSFRGIDNPVYYMAEPGHPAGYANYSGCGNTVNCNHPAVRRMILDSLRYWTEVMHVDGFRFDLASILSRDAAGRPLPHPPLLWEIENDPTLHHSTLIAEAWDAGGLYQVGAFPGERWREWNGQFRDDVRRFLRGDPGMSGAMARRMMASPDLYEASGRRPPQCVNFVTAHDGFTLADLVAYDRKHNTANGEGNRDGCDHEHSHGYGAEGPTDDPLVNAVRARQVRNFLTALFVAQGTPMLLSGDELGRTQGGNNNPWCQDNAISWLDWGLRSANADLHRFCRALIHRRRGHPSLRRTRYLVGHDAPADADIDGYTRVRWHGTRPDQPDWGHWNRLVAWSLTPASDDVALFVAFNAHTEALEVELPRPERGHGWLRVVDTALPSPEDISEHGAEPRVASTTYVLAPRSAIVLAASDVPPESPVSATQNLVIPPGLFGRGAD